MNVPEIVCCTAHASRLVESGAELVCPHGCRFPIVEGIPRFVPNRSYASAFGAQWRRWRKTQLDSHSRTTITRDRLERCLGSFDLVRGNQVVEAGCGAGRFTEVLLDEGARVVAFDLSDAVVANHLNHAGREGYFVMQADILRPPIAPGSADVVVCLGVIQHTPDPEETIASLASLVRAGGHLVIDHYSDKHPTTLVRRLSRGLLLRLPRPIATSLAVALSSALVPIHSLFWNRRRGSKRVRRLLAAASPLVDHYAAYPELGRRMLREWSILDTHDALTDHYKHTRTVDQIRATLETLGFRGVAVWEGGNGVEARARKQEGAAGVARRKTH